MEELGQEGIIAKDKQIEAKSDIVFGRQPARLSEMNISNRENKITSLDQQNQTSEITESNGLQELRDYLSAVKELPHDGSAESLKARELAEALDSTVFVGEQEMTEATLGIANRALSFINQGKQVYIYSSHYRSERFTAIRVLEQFHALTENTPELRTHIKFSEDPQKIAESAQNNPNFMVMIVDDFVLSGSRTRGSTMGVTSNLEKIGLDAQTVRESVEVAVVAAPDREDEFNRSYMTEEAPLFAYFGVKEIRGKDGKWVFHPGVSITGAHCSTDYGFETEIEKIQRFAEKFGLKRPSLAKISRPYDTVDPYPGSKYKDPLLQKRWEFIKETYGSN